MCIRFFMIAICLLAPVCFANEESKANELQNNIAFDLPDLTVGYQLPNQIEKVQLEAFRSLNNDKILAESDKTKYSQLMWVSTGNPRLIETVSRASPTPQTQLFHFTNEGFYTYVEMLSDAHSELLAERAKTIHQVNISPSQIVNLILSKFECSVSLYNGKSKTLINGKVTNFRVFPLRLDFWAPVDTKERRVFLERLNNSNEKLNIGLECEMASQGVELRTNTLTITAAQMSQLEMVDNIFGPVNETLVTREQMSSLSTELYSRLNIIEEYQIPETQFKEQFIDEFIKLVSSNVFQSMSIADAVASLSSFAITFTDDLRPDVIKSEAGKVLKVAISNEKKHIVVNEEGLVHLKETGKVTTAGGGGASFLGLFSINGSGGKVTDSTHEWLQNNKSLNEQMSELNSETRDEIEWMFEGEKIVPKSINVARLVKSKFSKTLTFSRIRKQYYEAPFLRKLSLYTLRSAFEKPELEKILELMEQKCNTLSNQIQETKLSVKQTENSVLQIINNQIQDTRLSISKTETSILQVVNQKHDLLSAQIQDVRLSTVQGGYSFSHIYANNNMRKETRRIDFGVWFKKPPTVILAIRLYDGERAGNTVYHLGPTHIANDHFIVDLDTWGNCKIYEFTFTWTAIGNL